MELNETIYAAFTPRGRIMGDGESSLISYDLDELKESAKLFAKINGCSSQEIKILPVKLVLVNQEDMSVFEQIKLGLEETVQKLERSE